MTGPIPRTSDANPHVVPTTMDEILKVAREHRVSPSGFCEGNGKVFGKEKPYGSVEDWDSRQGSESAPLMVGMCRAWIRCFGRNQKINPRAGSSYGFKHDVERHFGRYIGNGSFIVAAYLEGLMVARSSEGSPNAHFNFSKRDLADKERRLTAITV